MAESEGIQIIVNHATTKAATVVMMALRDVDAGLRSATNTARLKEPEAKTWQTSPKKAFTQCPGQVYLIT